MPKLTNEQWRQEMTDLADGTRAKRIAKKKEEQERLRLMEAMTTNVFDEQPPSTPEEPKQNNRSTSKKSLREELSSIIKVPDEVSLTEEEKERRDRSLSEIDRLSNMYTNAVDRERKLELAETLGHALLQLGAAKQGLRDGVDLSNIKQEKTDWRGRRKEDQTDIERKRRSLKDDIKEIDRDLQNRRQDRQRAIERRENIEASAIGKEWADRTSREREELNKREAAIKEMLKKEAEKDAELKKLLTGVDKANELKRQASETKDKKKKTALIGKARETLASSGIASEVIAEYFDELDEPNWLMSFFRDAEVVQKDPEDVNLTELKSRLIQGTPTRETGASPKESQGTNWDLQLGRLADIVGEDRTVVLQMMEYINNPNNPLEKRTEIREGLKDDYGI